jgi:hypothetical protein
VSAVDEEEAGPEESTGQETVKLLRDMDQRLEVIEATLVGLADAVLSGFTSVAEALAALQATEETIAATLATFLTDWQAANTPPPNQAVAVTVTWRQPQPIPKGTP